MTHSFSWVAWLLASLILLLTTRNPFLLSLILILLLALGVRLTDHREIASGGWDRT